jgi:hypothetical protein
MLDPPPCCARAIASAAGSRSAPCSTSVTGRRRYRRPAHATQGRHRTASQQGRNHYRTFLAPQPCRRRTGHPAKNQRRPFVRSGRHNDRRGADRGAIKARHCQSPDPITAPSSLGEVLGWGRWTSMSSTPHWIGCWSANRRSKPRWLGATSRTARLFCMHSLTRSIIFAHFLPIYPHSVHSLPASQLPWWEWQLRVFRSGPGKASLTRLSPAFAACSGRF